MLVTLVNEALHLAPQEEKKVVSIIRNIQDEYTTKIDRYSQEVVLAELELLFTYVTRFYNRQFVTRKITHHGVLATARCIVPEDGGGVLRRSFQANLWENYHTAAPQQRRQLGALSSKVQKAYKR